MGGLFGGQTISTSEPRIGALNVQTSAYGMVVPLVYGTNRIPANLVDYADFTAIPHTSTQSAGGKGGGGVTTSNTTYTYTVAVAMGLCEGPIAGLGNIWAGKEKVTLAVLGATLFDGASSQAPWGYMATNHPGHDLNYRGFAYIAAPAYPLGGSASLPQHSFEVRGLLRYTGLDDANPADIVGDVLTHARHGAGFPAAQIGSLTQFSDYCLAAGLLFSPAYTEAAPAQQVLGDLAKAANIGLVWSEGVLKFVPYGDTAITGALGGFTPNLTPAYDLTDDDFLGDAGGDPVIVSRKAQADAYNQVQVEYLDRVNQYNLAIATAQDQANADLYGLRPLPPLRMHFICQAAVARFVAQLVLQRHLYIRNTYEFRLGWKYALLEPMDLVTLTDAALGLNGTAVRIVAIEENEDGELSVTAEEFPAGIAHATQYPSQAGAGYQVNYNVDPGSANAPVIFEPPASLSGASEVWLATSGGANWGGCEVWVSRDDTTYAQVGTINGGARHGTLTASLPSGSDPDTTNTLAVDLTVSGGTLNGGTLADRDQMNTLSYVDGELVSFQTATLTAAHRYNLTSLRRGAYGSAVAAHSSGTKFARLDQALLKYAYDPAMIGQTIYLKLRSFNIYGLAKQDLAGLTPVVYTVAGSYLGSISGLALAQAFSGRSVKVKWDVYPGATGYEVEIWQSAALKRTVTGIASTAYEYTFEDMTADGGPWRSVDIKLYAVSGNGSSISAATLTVSNPQVAVPAGLSATAAPLSVTIGATKPADTDYAGMLVYGSTASGFTPGPGNLLYDGPGNSVTFAGLAAGTPRYYRVAFYDQYGKDGLNLSSEILVMPLAAGGVPIVAALPGSGTDGEVVSLTTNHKLYRWNAGAAAWQTWVDGSDILAASVTASKLSVATLSAINANMGAITAGSININNKFLVDQNGSVIIQNAAIGARLVVANNVIKVFDAAGVCRVKIGDLAA